MAKESLHVSQRSVLGRIDPYTFEELLNASNGPDVDYIPNLLEGFPITETLHVAGLGVDVPGGQRCHGKPGHGGPMPLSELQEKCVCVNKASGGTSPHKF